MKNRQCLPERLALAGGFMAAAIAGVATPALAASSATPQGDLITVSVGTLQFSDVSGESVITSGYSLASPVSARSEDGSFVSAWASSDYDNSATNVYAHRFNADGSSAGSDILVNAVFAAQESEIRYINPKVAADSSGNFVVVWQELSSDAETAILKARLFSADGAATSGEICVDPACTPMPAIGANSVVMQTNGNFTVAYVGSKVNASSPLYFRRFAQDGTALDTQPVEAYSNASSFSMALDRNSGKFAFAIDTNTAIVGIGVSVSTSSVHLRRYYENGNALGSSVTLGSCSEFDYLSVGYGCSVGNTSLGSDASGNLTVSWQRNSSPGARVVKRQTYMRHYLPSGYASGGKVTIDPASMLAQGFVAEDGAGNLIAAGVSSFQVFNNEGTSLGDAIPFVEYSNVSTDTSSNFVVTDVTTTYPAGAIATTVAAQRYSIP